MTYTSMLALVGCIVCMAAFAVSMKRLERLAERPGPDTHDLFWPMAGTLALMFAALAFGSAV